MANKAELLKRCEELGISTEGLTTNKLLEGAVKAREAELAAEKEAEEAKAAVEKAAKEKAEAEEAAKKVAAEKAAAKKVAAEEASKKAAVEKAAVYKDERGRKWKFKPTAPKKINIDGQPMSQEEIFESEDVITELVLGNSSFLTQIV